jgi:hypothetical protein
MLTVVPSIRQRSSGGILRRRFKHTCPAESPDTLPACDSWSSEFKPNSQQSKNLYHKAWDEDRTVRWQERLKKKLHEPRGKVESHTEHEKLWIFTTSVAKKEKQQMDEIYSRRPYLVDLLAAAVCQSVSVSLSLYTSVTRAIYRTIRFYRK